MRTRDLQILFGFLLLTAPLLAWCGWAQLPESEQNYPYSRMYINTATIRSYPTSPELVFTEILSNSLSKKSVTNSQVFREVFNCKTGEVTQVETTIYTGYMATGKSYPPMTSDIARTDSMPQTWAALCHRNQREVYNAYHRPSQHNEMMMRQLERDMQTDDIVQQIQNQQQLNRMLR